MDFAFFFSSSAAINFLFGIFTGFGATIFTLLVFLFIIAPKILFSHDIRRVLSAKNSRPSYSIRIKKVGYTSLIDTRIRCVIYIRDVHRRGSDLLSSYSIPTTFPDGLLYGSGSRIVHLKLHEANLLQNRLNNKIKKFLLNSDVQTKSFRLEDIFLSYDDVFIRVFVLGHDRYTGVKKLYVSHKYFLFNIRDGVWTSDSLKLLEHWPNSAVGYPDDSPAP